MLTVQKVTGGSAAPYARYLVARTRGADGRGDYYLNRHGRQESPGRWALQEIGQTLLDVDSDAPVTAQQLMNLLDVRFPNDDERQLRRGSNGTATAAIDLTFSAPKSVSIVWALGSEDTRRAIEDAHEHAIDAALAHAVEHVPMLRRRIDRETVIRERPAELLASVYRHTTARAVDGQAPDPQLHSHVLVHGAIRTESQSSDPATEDGSSPSVMAIESRALMVHQRELGAAYRASLADGLRDIGLAIDRNTGRDGRYFEVRGVPRPVIERFSSRHRQVRQRIEWRRLERLYGLRQLAAAGGERGREAQARLDVLAADLDERSDSDSSNPARATYELLERRDGLVELAKHLGPVGERARCRLVEIERWGDRLTPGQERVVARESRAPKAVATHGDLDHEWGNAAAALGFDTRDVAQLVGRHSEVAPDRGELQRAAVKNLTAHKATFMPREARAVMLETTSSAREADGLLRELAARGDLVRLEQGRFTTIAQRALERHVLRHARAVADGRVQAIDAQLVNDELDRLGAHLPGGLSSEQDAAIRAATSDRQLVAIQGQAGTGKSTALIAASRAETAAGREVLITSTGGQAAERLAAELREAGVPAQAFSTRALEAAYTRGSLRLGPDTTIVHDECALAATDEQNFLFWSCADSGARLVEVGDREQNIPVGAGGLMRHVEKLASDRGAFVALEQIVRARDEHDRAMQQALRVGETRAVVENLERRDRLVVAATRTEATQRAVELWQEHRHSDGGALVLCESSNHQVDELNAQLQSVRQDAGELGHDSVPVPGRPYALYVNDEIVFRSQFVDTEIGTVRNGERGKVTRIDAGKLFVELDAGRRVALNDYGIDEADLRLSYAQHANPAQGATTGTAIAVVSELSTRRGQYVSLTRGRHAHYLVSSYEALAVPIEDGRVAALSQLAEQLNRDEPEVPSIDFAERASDSVARRDALELIARLAGNDLAERAANAVDRDQAAQAKPISELVARAAELRDALSLARSADIEAHAAARAAAAENEMRQRLEAERERVAATRDRARALGRLQRRERAQLERLTAVQENAITALAERLTQGENPQGQDLRQPGHATLENHAIEYLEVEVELSRRFSTAHEDATRAVRLMPSNDIADRLGARPNDGLERELWERDAVHIELHRLRYGSPPDIAAGVQQEPPEWRTAREALARLASDRDERPAPQRDADLVDGIDIER